MKPTRERTRPTFSEFREQLWQHTESRALLDSLDSMYDQLRNDCLHSVNQVAVKKEQGAVPPDSGFVMFDGQRVLALRYESVREAISRVFDRRRKRKRVT